MMRMQVAYLPLAENTVAWIGKWGKEENNQQRVVIQSQWSLWVVKLNPTGKTLEVNVKHRMRGYLYTDSHQCPVGSYSRGVLNTWHFQDAWHVAEWSLDLEKAIRHKKNTDTGVRINLSPLSLTIVRLKGCGWGSKISITVLEMVLLGWRNHTWEELLEFWGFDALREKNRA